MYGLKGGRKKKYVIRNWKEW